MATVTLTTDTAALFSHDIYFELILEDDSSADYDIDLIDIGKLSYEFDVPNEGTDVSSVGIRGGAMDIVLDNYMVGTSLMDIIVSAYQHDDELVWSAQMYFRDKGGSYGEPIPFNFDQRDIKFDVKSQKVELALRPYSGAFDTQIDSFFGDVWSEVAQYDIDGLSGSAEQGIISGEFLEYATHYIYKLDNSFPIGDTIVSTDVFESDNVSSGNDWFVSDWFINDDFSDVGDVLGIMASLEGGVFGTALGVPFYFSRTYNDPSLRITLTTSNIEELNTNLFTDAEYRSVDIEFWDTSSLRVANTLNAEKNLNISFDLQNLLYCTVDSSSTATNGTRNNNLVTQGTENYFTALGMGNSMFLNVTHWGISGIHPSSIISFDADAPDAYQDEYYRIKKIEYDWKADKVKMEIYQI